ERASWPSEHSSIATPHQGSSPNSKQRTAARCPAALLLAPGFNRVVPKVVLLFPTVSTVFSGLLLLPNPHHRSLLGFHYQSPLRRGARWHLAQARSLPCGARWHLAQARSLPIALHSTETTGKPACRRATRPYPPNRPRRPAQLIYSRSPARIVAHTNRGIAR